MPFLKPVGYPFKCLGIRRGRGIEAGRIEQDDVVIAQKRTRDAIHVD